jgi:5-(carboxyamino)imidazole ribonucleotide synthase
VTTTEHKHSIAEEFIPFRRELAVILARSRSGDIVQLPVVETYQENSKCLWVKGPIKEDKVLKALISKFKKLMKTIDYTGVLAFELFDTKTGYLVNELAPRVHNSGHYSQDAVDIDQFALHLQCILGMKLAQPRLRTKSFAMWNLLGKPDQMTSGSSNSSSEEKSEDRPMGGSIQKFGKKPKGGTHRNSATIEQNLNIPIGRLHWYGKEKSRPGRKLGHINVVSNLNPDQALLGVKKSAQKIGF